MTAPLPPVPALHASHAGVWIAEPDGGTQACSRGQAVSRAADTPVIVMNAPLVGQRLGYADLSGLDLLELFAFVHPARFMVPTPKGLAEALGLAGGDNDEQAVPRLYLAAAGKLLATLADPGWAEREGAWDSAAALMRLRWPWASLVLDRLKKPEKSERWLFSRLPEWEEGPPRPAPKLVTIDEVAALDRLAALTGDGAERREGQRRYAVAALHPFSPRAVRDRPNMLVAEAGTGIGKTLGYLAPASLWAERAGGTVWVSTYTKALQRQLVRETQRLYPDPAAQRAKVVVRKGRENYLCLLNLEDALQGGFAGRAAVLAQLVARWAAYSRDGDMIGGDLPGWLVTLFRRNGATALTDRRGECIYAGCPHYRRCFIERAARASGDADIVIANHALVMVGAARHWQEDGRDAARRPTRLVFDEGHHLFDAADSMFAAAITGQEAIELRRWIMGPEGRSRGRRRGLAARLADVASHDEDGARAIEALREAACALPSDQWLQRLTEGAPFGPFEAMLAEIRALTYARDESGTDAGYGLETELADPPGALVEAVEAVRLAVEALHRPMVALGKRLAALLADPPDWLDGAARARVEGAGAALGWRVEMLAAWASLLARVAGPADPDFVDWFQLDRIEGREIDVGLHRHWLDPMRPVAETVVKPAHGLLVTSATLTDGGDWSAALARAGAAQAGVAAETLALPSPFAYATQAEVLIVTDVAKGDMAALAGAYARLIEASGGGALGLFTAIRRLRIVHARIADRLARSGLPLLAQHVDPIDTGTLVDIFRDDPRSSLLGTDALRDGVDVPGQSLRLVILEGVPWVKPSILHRARRMAGGGQAYDDRIIRGKLAQGFGRLIRRADDRGRFVILSPAMPSRLLSAFPPGTPIRRVPLDEAVRAVREGLSSSADIGQVARETG